MLQIAHLTSVIFLAATVFDSRLFRVPSKFLQPALEALDLSSLLLRCPRILSPLIDLFPPGFPWNAYRTALLTPNTHGYQEPMDRSGHALLSRPCRICSGRARAQRRFARSITTARSFSGATHPGSRPAFRQPLIPTQQPPRRVLHGAREVRRRAHLDLRPEPQHPSEPQHHDRRLA